MASGSQRRTRSERVAALELTRGPWNRAWSNLWRRDALARIAMCVAAAVILCVVVRGWAPPFPYRLGYVFARDFSARVPFEAVDSKSTEAALERAQRQVRPIYILNPQPLEQFPALMANAAQPILDAASFDRLQPKQLEIWSNFLPRAKSDWRLSQEESQERFEKFCRALASDRDLVSFQRAVTAALAPYRETGLLLSHPNLGNRDEIDISRKGGREPRKTVRVADILADDDSPLQRDLLRELKTADLADPAFQWIRWRLAVAPALLMDESETRKALDAAMASAGAVVVNYVAGQSLAEAKRPLDEDQVRLLRLEHAAFVDHIPLARKALRAASLTILILVLFVFCGVGIYRRDSRMVGSLPRLAATLGMLVVTVLLATWAATDLLRAEIIPLLVFGQTVAIAYRQDLAVLLGSLAALIITLALGHDLVIYLLMVGTTVTAVLQVGRIRSRSKLTYVGICTGVAAFLLTFCLATLENQPISWPLLTAAGLNALWAIAAGFLMTVILPFLERAFGVLTDLSLLELGDVSHPLLQELIRRAPSTYNHSLTVGSIAEAAAEAIGARGLLCRIGAYYHDIGKMLKPGYFIENQPRDQNRHESLVPAMSTLVIIAHIKDGADLARQHGLPQLLIDFIEQHHGTTLVEYFFGRAHEQQQKDPNGSEVDESLYRYPGPKPQTKESGVLMLADAVESASRSLIDPAPSRIESLVREIAERKLDDGQFDESGLTLPELRTIEDSMIKSLIANYHGRVKYPDQKTA